MGFLFDRLYPASYKGAEFYFITDSRTDGRRVIIHEYPGQSDDTEDLGKRTRQFSIQAIIKGFFYEDNKKRLEEALNTEGAGILVHPFLGIINCVSLGFTVVENTGKVGVANYTLTFKEVIDKTYPIPSSDVTSLIANLYNRLYDFIRDYLNGEYVVDFLANIEHGAQKLRELENITNSIVASIKGGDTDKSDYESSARNIKSNSIKIASPNGDIGSNISDFISIFDIISVDGQIRFDSSNKLFGFGENDIYLNFDTVKNNQDINNLKIINGSINVLALTNMSDAAKNIDYTDQNQLDAIVTTLNDNYNYLIDSDKVILKENLLDQLDDIRVQMNKFFNQIRLTLPKLIEIETKPIPLAVLVYQYYGDINNYNIILDLNNIYNPSRVSGVIKMLAK